MARRFRAILHPVSRQLFSMFNGTWGILTLTRAGHIPVGLRLMIHLFVNQNKGKMKDAPVGVRFYRKTGPNIQRQERVRAAFPEILFEHDPKSFDGTHAALIDYLRKKVKGSKALTHRLNERVGKHALFVIDELVTLSKATELYCLWQRPRKSIKVQAAFRKSLVLTHLGRREGSRGAIVWYPISDGHFTQDEIIAAAGSMADTKCELVKRPKDPRSMLVCEALARLM